MRRPEGAGGGLRAMAASSQRLTCDVGMRLLQRLHGAKHRFQQLVDAASPAWRKSSPPARRGFPAARPRGRSSPPSASSAFPRPDPTWTSASTTARPSCATRSHSVRSCRSIGSEASISTTTHSAKRMARNASDTASFSILPVTRDLRRMPAVSHSLIFWPRHSKSDEIASRVMPGFGAGQHALFAEDGIDQRRLAGIGLADDGQAQRPVAALLAFGFRLFPPYTEEVRHRDSRGPRHVRRKSAAARQSPAHRLRARHAFCAAALGLVGHQNDRLAAAAHALGEFAVGRRDAGPRVDDEEHDIGIIDRRLGLGAHARFERCRP